MPRSEKPRLSPTEGGRFEKQEIQDVKEEGRKEGGTKFLQRHQDFEGSSPSHLRRTSREPKYINSVS